MTGCRSVRKRKKIVAAGMEWEDRGFNCPGISGYLLDLVGAGKYSAPWMACNVCRLSDAGLVLYGDFPGWET